MNCYDYDLIIVGGGPAGATMALYAAKGGLSVLLVDEKQFPRDKICGDLIPLECMRILREFHLLEKLLQEPHCLITHMVLHSEQECLRFPCGDFSDDELIISKRTIFDNILFQTAKARVETQEGWKVKNLLVKNGQVFGVQGKTQSGESFEYTAKVVAGADGYNSIVARKLGFYQHDAKHWGVATRAYYRNIPIPLDEIEYHYLQGMLGYLWIFPVDNETINVGVGTLFSTLKKKKESLRDLHQRLTQSLSLKKRFERAELIGKIQGWNLPLASIQRPMHGNGVILAGDAAGLIDPLWGDGIGTAMIAGKIAGEILSTVCRGNDYSAEILGQYTDAVWDGLGPRFKYNYDFRRLLSLRPFLYPSMTEMKMFNKFIFRDAGTITQRTDVEVQYSVA